MTDSEARVMAFPRKMVESILLGLSNPLNRHLVKLVAFDFPDELRRHVQREVKNWLIEIKALRFKPGSRTGSFKFYFDLLFDYPFGGIEIEYERRPTKTPQEMVEWLRAFHTQLAERLHNGEDVLDLIPE